MSQAATTGLTGSGAPFDNSQPSLGLNYLIRTSGGTLDGLGEVGLYGTDTSIPTAAGWTLAHGQTLSIASNQDLFSKIGTTFGGDGIETFKLPDLRGRTAIGAGQGAGLPNYALGQYVGNEQATIANLPSHSHNFGSGFTTDPTSQSGSHSNMQPSLALTPIIANTGVYPSRSSYIVTPGTEADSLGPQPIGTGNDEPLWGEVTWIAHDDVPEGWLRAEGQLLSINEHQVLFSLLGIFYGGNGETNFALPDLRGRAIVNQGNGPGVTNRFIGSELGNESESLTVQQIPSHSHEIPTGGVTDAFGSASPQTNLQPTLAMSYLVATEGIFPSSSSSLTEGVEEETEGELIPQSLGSVDPILGSIPIFAGNFNPRGFALAQGQTFSIAQYSALFSLYWDNFGSNIQTGIFDLPDLRGRVAVGAGTGDGLTARMVGDEFGTEASSLVEVNLPEHVHEYVVPGDYNNDGTVDAADYTVWRDNVGAAAGTLPNDTTGTLVGVEQYNLWVANYGETAESLMNSQSVPEPVSWFLIVMAMFGYTAKRSHHAG